MKDANAPGAGLKSPSRRFRARACFGGYHGCEIEFVPTNGRQYECACCNASKRREYFRSAEHLASKRAWREANPESSRVYVRRAYHKARELSTPAQRHDRNLRRRYRLSLAGKLAILLADGGACLVCGLAIAELSEAEIDHDHACCAGRLSCGSCIRGVIHQDCNQRVYWLELAGELHPYLISARSRMLRNDAIRLATFGQKVSADQDLRVPGAGKALPRPRPPKVERVVLRVTVPTPIAAQIRDALRSGARCTVAVEGVTVALAGIRRA